jgi:hypothetical protein
MTLRWEEPSNIKQVKTARHAAIAAALKERRGEWAVIAEGITRGQATGWASNVSAGRFLSYQPKGAFEALSRKNGDDASYKVYARYVGEEL